MSILNQLFELVDSNTQDPSVAPVDVQLSTDHWVAATTSYAAHQAFVNGFVTKELRDLFDRKIADSQLGSIKTSETLSRPQFGSAGTVSALKTIEIIRNWEQLFIRQQLEPVPFRATAEDFVDGGIKKGSKVVIQVVRESNNTNSSPYDIARASLSRGQIQGEPVSLVFDKFSVMSINEPDEARFQIHQTFGADIIQSFGRRPRIMMISGNVLNGKARASFGGEIRSMDWKNAFQRFYQNYASLHATVTGGKHKVRIYCQDTVYDGYLLNMMSQTSAEVQSVSQVTITFLVARKYYPNSNDSKIPGYTNEAGFRITAASTPEDYFPSDRIEFHFQNDPKSLISKAQDATLRKLQQLEAEIKRLDPGVGDLSSAILGVDENSPYLAPAQGFKLHKLLKGGDTEKTLKDHSGTISALKEKIDFHIILRGGKKQEAVSGLAADVPDDALDLQIQQAIYRSVNNGLQERVSKLNNLAAEYTDTMNYWLHLTDL